MKIDRRFEEALGVGPRFIMKVVTRTFGLTGVSTENKWLIVRRPKSKPCEGAWLLKRATVGIALKVLFSSFWIFGITESKHSTITHNTKRKRCRNVKLLQHYTNS